MFDTYAHQGKIRFIHNTENEKTIDLGVNIQSQPDLNQAKLVSLDWVLNKMTIAPTFWHTYCLDDILEFVNEMIERVDEQHLESSTETVRQFLED